MDSTTNTGFPTNFILSVRQQNLILEALNSKKHQSVNQSSTAKDTPTSPSSYQTSPTQDAAHGFQESPYLDNYDYDFGDTSFDFDVSNVSQGNMIGDIPGGVQSAQSTKSDLTENDGADKRAHPDDDEDEGSPVNGAKRREGVEKVHKKPGRKPLTSEPTSKRKAQNRAAQRAFRERKVKHVKDLETKVEQLEKASKHANSENNQLRAQIEQLRKELDGYRAKIAAVSSWSVSHGKTMEPGMPAIGNLGDVNFQFKFPKFGILPGSQLPNNPAQSATASLSSHHADGSKPLDPLYNKDNSAGLMTELDFGAKNDMANFRSLFVPSSSNIMAGIGTSRTSVDSGSCGITHSVSTGSPSVSSQSNGGPSSSCGTSPEPFTQSPRGTKPVETMTTIGEEASSQQGFLAEIDTSNFDWLAQQNGGQFDPQLFGDYREPQENILAGTSFDDSFFKDALDADFIIPYNMAPNTAVPKKNLLDQIDEAKNADDDVVKEAVKAENYNCHKIWEKLQNCPSVQAGELDLDGLCTELQKKAKCSGQGPVVSETDFQTVINKWIGKDATACFTSQTKTKTRG